MKKNKTTPDGYTFEIQQSGFLHYCLSASQILRINRERAFEFFKDPQNLCDITPVWLDFCMIDKDSNTKVFKNAEFDYTIKWFGIKMKWRSRIVDFNPPESFTDIQVRGPYRSWVHLHTLEEVPEGTLMKDRVTYKIPFFTLPFHTVLIKRHLEEIFSYRAEKVMEWARTFTR